MTAVVWQPSGCLLLCALLSIMTTRPERCPECTRIFKSFRALSYHMDRCVHHQRLTSRQPSKRFSLFAQGASDSLHQQRARRAGACPADESGR